MQLDKAVCGTPHLFCYMKLILFFFNEMIMYLMSSAECLGGHYILPTFNIFLQKQSSSVDMLKALDVLSTTLFYKINNLHLQPLIIQLEYFASRRQPQVHYFSSWEVINFTFSDKAASLNLCNLFFKISPCPRTQAPWGLFSENCKNNHEFLFSVSLNKLVGDDSSVYEALPPTISWC